MAEPQAVDYDPFASTSSPRSSAPTPVDYDPFSTPRLTSGRRETPDVSAEQKLGAFGRGIVTGIPGGAGEFESFVTQSVPKILGFEGAPSTLFPKTSDYERYIQSGEKALGLKPGVDPRVEGYQKGGEFIGEFLTPVTAMSKPIVSAYKASRAKPLEEAIGTLKTSAEELASKAAETSAQVESEAVRATYDQARRRGINLSGAELQRAGQAQVIREDTARTFADLGKPKPVAELGDEMQRRLTGTQFTRGARREQQASRDYGEYFKQAEGFENSSARNVMLKRLESMAQDPSAGSAGRKYAADAFKDLSESKNAMGAEKEFRKYFEQASAPQQAGYGAVEQAANRAVSDIISEGLNTHAPLRVEVRNTYKEYSTPLDAYETQFGKKAVATEKAVPGQVQMMPTDYPKQYFQNRDTIRVLREQLAGDEAAVRKFANQHVVNELQGKNAEQAKAWLAKNDAWVNEVEGLNGRVAKYVRGLEQAELKAGTLEEQINKIRTRKTELGKIRQSVEDRIVDAATKDREAIALKSKFLQSSEKSSQVPTEARSFVQDLFKRKIINEQEFDKFSKEITKLEEIAKTKEEAARRIRRYIGGALGMSAGTFGIRRALGV
jgi:hypothetical protein